jgi:PIN domain nuclease of toxin-antitoxin system
MSILLDTQVLLWTQGEPNRIPGWLVDQLEQTDYNPWFSVVSIWEVVIKANLKKKDFNYDPNEVRTILIERGWRELVLTSQHVLAVINMEPLHGDPFDRVLIAQAMAEGLTLITSDSLLSDYGPMVRLI